MLHTCTSNWLVIPLYNVIVGNMLASYPGPLRRRRKGLVHTVCACIIFPVKAGNSYFCPFTLVLLKLTALKFSNFEKGTFSYNLI